MNVQRAIANNVSLKQELTFIENVLWASAMRVQEIQSYYGKLRFGGPFCSSSYTLTEIETDTLT